jgi:hypothetical protein
MIISVSKLFHVGVSDLLTFCNVRSRYKDRLEQGILTSLYAKCLRPILNCSNLIVTSEKICYIIGLLRTNKLICDL